MSPPSPAVPVAIEVAASELEPIAESAQSVSRYQAMVDVRGRGPEGGFRATQVLVFERPDRIRVELLGAFGATRWIAVASSHDITVVFPGRDEFLREERVEDVVGALMGVRLRPREVIAILTGTGFPLESHDPVFASRRGARLEVDLGGSFLELERGQVRRARDPRYEVRYPEDWREQGRQVPYHIDISTETLEARLRLETIDVNIPLHPEAFEVRLPEEGTRLRLEEIGGEAVFVKTDP